MSAAPLWTRLAIGASNDQPEREADRVADQVLAASAHSAVSGVAPQIQRYAEQATAGQAEAAPDSVDRVLSSSGQPLEPAVRKDMEHRFGHDFARVRVHSGMASEQSAADVNAHAYTVGHDIVFGAGRYAPGTEPGRRLIAHELTHVVQQSDAVAGTRELPLQRDPDDKTKAAPAPKPAPAPRPAPPRTSAKKGLNRTLYVVNNDVWAKLPATVRASAEQQLNTLFAFVGAASTEKPFSISIVTPAQMPEQFDFSESVVSVIHGDTKKYVDEAFARQTAQIRTWLATQKVQMAETASGGKAAFKPERMGTAGGSRTVLTDQGKKFAMPIMAGAVDIDEVMDSFFDNIDSLLEKELKALPGKGKDPAKWPQTLTKGASSWQPLAMLGEALGRAIAHEARHEYLGAGHAEEGLGSDSPFIIGEKNTAQFSKDDEKAMLEQIRKLEATQGTATVVPTFPQSMRNKPEDFPF